MLNLRYMSKDSELSHIRERVSKITDSVGHKIDQGIQETIVFLNALGINTTGSCEGHLDGGFASPWVDIGPKETKKFVELSKKTSALRAKMRKEEEKKVPNEKLLDKLSGQHYDLNQIKDKYTQKEIQKIYQLLEKFYQNRNPEFLTRLVLSSFGWDARLQSQGLPLQILNNSKLRKENLKRYKDEMNLFTEFLKKEYFKK